MSAPTPDLRPHVTAPIPGSECCGCCEGVEVDTPREITNRTGLSEIAYRIGEYAHFRDSLQARLTNAASPQLSALRTRGPDDFTIALIDAFACAADVLTFYQERIANESFLRTAVERVSLQEMGKLIGYRLRPGVAAETWLAVALETPPVPPETLKPEPGNFVTGVPDVLTLPSGLKVQSVPGPDEKPQVFETVEELAEARAAWNAMQPWLRETRRPGYGDTVAHLAGLRTSLKPGDAVLFVGDEYLESSNNDNWDFRIVERVDLDPRSETTVISWQRPLGSMQPFSNAATQQPQVHALRKRASVFGHNAPLYRSMPKSFRADYESKTEPTAKDWPFALSPSGTGYVDLDAVYPDVNNGGYVVLAKGAFNYGTQPPSTDTYVELYSVSNVAEASRADFALSGKVTRVRLSGENYDKFAGLVRDTAVFAASEELDFADYPVATAVSGDRIPVNTAAHGMIAGRRLIVRGRRVSDDAEITVQATLVKAHVVDAARCELEIKPPLPASLKRATVVVYGNVLAASHGESVSQILGNGNAAAAFQRFELRQQPLTYRAAASELGVAPELSVRVGDVEWQERASLFGAARGAHVYATDTDEQARAHVVFGDGVRGARLPSGLNNVRAEYRVGLGSAGNLAAGKLTQLMLPPLGVKSVSNPMPTEGGADPEPVSAARSTIPLTTRTLGRAVSVLDYEDYARAYAGIAKAQARVLSLRGGRTVVITIAGPNGTAITTASPTWTNLLDALRENGDPYVPVQLVSYQASTFRIGLRIKRDPAYTKEKVLTDVEAELRARYSFVERGLAQTVQQSEVISVVQSVPGVIAVDITRLYGGTFPTAQTVPGTTQTRLLASQMRVQAGVAKAAELLTLNPAPFDQLEEMT